MRSTRASSSPDLLQRDDRVLESRLLRIGRDLIHFLQFLRHPLLVGGREMLVLDLIERRNVIWERALREQRICGH